jgi:hypothetical protein
MIPQLISLTLHEKGENYGYRKVSQTDSETLCLRLTGGLPGPGFRRRQNEGFLWGKQ